MKISATLTPAMKFRYVGLVLLVSSGSFATAAVNFSQCMADIRQGLHGSIGGTDNSGNPVNVADATAITYGLCKSACGTGAEPFQWSVFSQQFSAWLLPWLALISQLPFGAKLRSENLMSMLLAVGSPTLAAYSLALTVLNGHWIARRFADIRYPNTRYAVRVLSSLQQAPLKITADGLLSSLVVLPENDAWWEELTEELDYTHTWSISAATSIAWVVIAYLFTVIDSFTNIEDSVNSNGQGVGSVWLWLLPIVVGWLQISPKCHSEKINKAINKANAVAFAAASDPTAAPVLAETLSGNRAFSLQKYRPGGVYHDEECSAPIHNYTRFFPWVHAVEEVWDVFHYASENARHNRPVNPNFKWQKGARSGEIHPANRSGCMEHVDAYCMAPSYVRRSRWGSNVWTRSVIAALLSLLLQWGTTGAAVVVVWFTPTKGLGCRSAAYILYAVLSTVVWVLMVTSSILAHCSTFNQSHKEHHRIADASTCTAAVLSIILRRLGKLIATCNAVWIVLACVFQFSSFFDRCYCNSSVFGLRDKAYDVIIFVSSDLHGMKSAWIGGVVLALGSAFAFIGFVNIFINPPLQE